MERPDDYYYKIPRWLFNAEETGHYFLLSINPDGKVDWDGGHSDIEGCASAKHLIERINCIPKQEGRRYVCIKIEEVPEFTGKVNEDALSSLNENLK